MMIYSTTMILYKLLEPEQKSKRYIIWWFSKNKKKKNKIETLDLKTAEDHTKTHPYFNSSNQKKKYILLFLVILSLLMYIEGNKAEQHGIMCM